MRRCPKHVTHTTTHRPLWFTGVWRSRRPRVSSFDRRQSIHLPSLHCLFPLLVHRKKVFHHMLVCKALTYRCLRMQASKGHWGKRPKTHVEKKTRFMFAVCFSNCLLCCRVVVSLFGCCVSMLDLRPRAIEPSRNNLLAGTTC